MAISVPKRFFKRAHDRNRIKRLARETYRIEKIALQSKVIDHQWELNLMFIYQGREILEYSEMQKHMHQSLLHLQQRVFPTPPEQD